MSIWLFIIIILLLAFLGAPLFTIISAIGLYAFTSADIDTSAMIIDLYKIADTPTLLAVPLFTFAGYLLAESKAPKRLVDLAQALFGWMPAGLAIVALVTCALFTAFTGASGVTIVALGGLLYPILLKENYPEQFSLGLVTASGSIGLLFPPSLPIILYGFVAGVSIDQLFVAGLIPGVLLIAFLSAYSLRVSIKAKVPKIPFHWKKVATTLRAAAWELPLPFVVIGGIYGGAFTATEAAAITAFYAFVVEVFIYKDLHLFRDVPRVMKKSMVLVGAILMILGSALGLMNYLIDQQVPQRLFEVVQQHVSSRVMFLLILNGFLIIIGMVMEIFSAIVAVPLILPIAAKFNIDPVHLGIIFLTNLELGYLMPPMGLNLFLSSLRFEKSIFHLSKAVIGFILMEIVALLVITYVPELSLWLPRYLGTQ
ncbi:MAG: TRAP transporter large permease subunit [Ignavibacteria bacterium]|jgi:tripartite ATP-independent transporter DctM subunit|nr:TRAP transporter large permease subunit [Ignavibacteria bacterium]